MKRKRRIYMTNRELELAADRWQREQWPQNNIIVAAVALGILITLIGVGVYFGVVTP